MTYSRIGHLFQYNLYGSIILQQPFKAIDLNGCNGTELQTSVKIQLQDAMSAGFPFVIVANDYSILMSGNYYI